MLFEHKSAFTLADSDLDGRLNKDEFMIYKAQQDEYRDMKYGPHPHQSQEETLEWYHALNSLNRAAEGVS